MKKKFLMFLAAATLLTMASCKKDEESTPDAEDIAIPSGQFKLELEHQYADLPLALNNTYFTNQGEELQFQNFKYYLTNVKLIKADGSVWSHPESYFLIDLGNPSSLLPSITGIPEGDYTSIQFMIGVDSTRNVSGAQTGALAVSNNMFWTWSTGYIMAKFEGTSPQAPGSTFSYHVGGFQGVLASQQVLNFAFAPEVLMIRKSTNPLLKMSIDAQRIFNNDQGINIHDNPTVHQPGMMAKRVIQNFVSGIEFEHIHN